MWAVMNALDFEDRRSDSGNSAPMAGEEDPVSGTHTSSRTCRPPKFSARMLTAPRRYRPTPSDVLRMAMCVAGKQMAKATHDEAAPWVRQLGRLAARFNDMPDEECR